MTLPGASSSRYSDAQLDDYAGLARARYPHQAPLRLSLRARFSHEAKSDRGDTLNTGQAQVSPCLPGSLLGTAGFGLWNNPFGAQSKFPALPQAIWYFYASPPSNMALALGVPGFGWKAACLDAGRAAALAWSPLALPVMLLCRRPKLCRSIWPRVQRSLAIRESLLTFRAGNLTDWHTYELEWRPDGARWQVDGETALDTERPPRGPLGFVAWIDNQYAVVTPQGKFNFGLLDTPREQWLELGEVEVTRET
ncbi:MAG TPA: hypothetical protein VJ754_05660 [Anaerolineae bacterium]|nr:hypothetical protein [Anaerolineae bacterium]